MPDTPKVHRVVVQLSPPTDDHPGQITEGYYIVDDGVLVMVHADGKPVDDELFRHRLGTGDNARAIAKALTRKVRRHLLGLSPVQEKFARRIEYGKAGIA